MKRILLIISILFAAYFSACGQSAIIKDFQPVCDTLAKLIEERNTIHNNLRLKAVMKRGNSLDFYFTESLGDFVWHNGDPDWFRKTLKSHFPEKYSKYRLGEIYSNRISIERLVTPVLGHDGNPVESKYKVKAPGKSTAIVEEEGALKFDKGMDGRHIALWQSHGRYYDCKSGLWKWQRPCLFQTCEDMFTQGFVLPFLVPMLENAGAYVFMPRERDIQRHEIIADNDAPKGGRGKALYEEKGKWSDAGQGFADPKPVYEDLENPFQMGTARQIESIPQSKKTTSASITWTPEIPEKGEYAVYVSYKTLPNSVSAASYTVFHAGGKSSFVVNQKMGGGTWIYLGTFVFEDGDKGYVRLDNRTPEGYKHINGSIVTADAVRFGGGMGNIARGCLSEGKDSTLTTSGMPRSAEAARYYLQWAGADSTVYSQNKGENDYKDDYMSRPDWVEWMTRGSRTNPDAKGGLNIPIDLTFAWHSDAGVTPNDSLIGTLAIYTLKSERKQTLPAGENRMTSREYADIVQSQIVEDMRFAYDTIWRRRAIRDRGYRESRTPTSPAMLLEFLSHQNFADMKYGLDPSFRFAVSRSVYKGMLKYLSNRYGTDYTVQPLPVNSLGVAFGNDGKAVISWKPTDDPLEPTAKTNGYILYTRVNDGAFDNGIIIKDIRKSGDRLYAEFRITHGNIYSFRVCAYNNGGKSFPSETVSIGLPTNAKGKQNILIVNNFDRVSAPAFFDTPTYAGFDNRLDSGVPYVRDITFVGEMYQWRRTLPWTDDENPGFGASYGDKAGEIVAGNTFDYPYIHGKAVLKAGFPFYSCSNETFCNDSTFRKNAWSIDLICGKQITTTVGNGMQQKYSIFPKQMQDALEAFTEDGGNILISGSNIGTDVEDQIFPIKTDSTFRADSKRFIRNVLGYKWRTNYASRQGCALPCANTMTQFNGKFSFYNSPNPTCYSVETPDGIIPASDKGETIMRYADTDISAGIAFKGNGYKTLCLGFPIEALHNEEDIFNIINTTIQFFAE